MIIWNPKAPDETVGYNIDWGPELRTDLIESFTLEVTSGAATILASGFSGNLISALIMGGTDGGTTVFANEIRTVDQQVLTKTISLFTALDANPKIPSTATKRAIVELAFQECRLNNYQFDITPAELNAALQKLDNLMSQWAVTGMDLGYNHPVIYGQGDLEEESGIPNAAVNGSAISLALRIAPNMGKTMSAETRRGLAEGMSAISTMTAQMPNRLLTKTTPLGSGNKPWTTWDPYPQRFLPGGQRQ